jgi:hypothetical protein
MEHEKHKLFYGSKSGQMPDLNEMGMLDASGSAMMTPQIPVELPAGTKEKVEQSIALMDVKEKTAYFGKKASKRGY